jgi:sporulation protein YlmC with PRC-barrel domain
MTVTKCFAALALLFTCVGYGTAQVTTDSAPEADSSLNSEYSANYRGEGMSASNNTHRASEVIGLNVMTPNNEDTIGEVDDLVLDANNGNIRYAAVSVGGFLGIGDKLVAVPWKAFECKRDEDGNSYLSLDTTKEKLEKAPGFNQDNWPNFGDQKWSSENDRHYGVSVNINSNR